MTRINRLRSNCITVSGIRLWDFRCAARVGSGSGDRWKILEGSCSPLSIPWIAFNTPHGTRFGICCAGASVSITSMRSPISCTTPRADEEFWSQWRDEDAPADRLAESFVFRLAKEWFGCRLNPIVDGYAQELPASVERWFRLFAFSPIASIGRPNKDELFLNLCLAQNGAERWRIAARRIFPVRVPVSVPDAHVVDKGKHTSAPACEARCAEALFHSAGAPCTTSRR